jgi:predicted phosphodiesterase
MKTLVAIPDLHVPYHDERALRVVLKVIKKLQPDYVVQLGDWSDNAAFSRHPRRSDKIDSYKEIVVPAVTQVRQRIEAAAGKAKLIVTEGNHDFWIERYILSNAPALFGAVNMWEDCGFDRWEVIPYGDFKKVGKLYISHDFEKSGKDAHMDSIRTVGGSVLHGHTHRLGWGVLGNAKGAGHVGCSAGWLGLKRHAAYRHKALKNAEWALGFAVAHFDKQGNVFLQPVTIVNYKCVVNGILFS